MKLLFFGVAAVAPYSQELPNLGRAHEMAPARGERVKTMESLL
jgi:hypothetical protein